MEAPRRVPSREQGGSSRPGLSLRCARQQRSTRGAFGQTTLVPADLFKAEERANMKTLLVSLATFCFGLSIAAAQTIFSNLMRI